MIEIVFCWSGYSTVCSTWNNNCPCTVGVSEIQELHVLKFHCVGLSVAEVLFDTIGSEISLLWMPMRDCKAYYFLCCFAQNWRGSNNENIPVASWASNSIIWTIPVSQLGRCGLFFFLYPYSSGEILFDRLDEAQEDQLCPSIDIKSIWRNYIPLACWIDNLVPQNDSTRCYKDI